MPPVKQYPDRCVPCVYRQLDDGAPPCRRTDCPSRTPAPGPKRLPSPVKGRTP